MGFSGLFKENKIMDLSVGNPLATDCTSTAARTFEDFVTKPTSSVEDVLKKARSFGFREVDIYFGSKKIPPEEGTDQAIYLLDGKRFCFTGLSDHTVNQNTSRLVKRFFSAPILRKLCQSDNARKEAAYNMIEKAFKYHDFIEKSAWKFRPQKETLSDFLRRNNEEDHFTFLQDITQGMKDGPNITVHRNGYYLLALWVELSNAMSPDFQRIDLFNWRDFAVVKSRPVRNKRKPLPEILLPRPRKKLKVEEKVDASHSAGNTINFTLSSSGNNPHYLPDNQQKIADTQKPPGLERTSTHHDAEHDAGIEQETSQNKKEPLEEASSCRENNSTFLEMKAKADGPSCSNTDDSTIYDTDESTVYDSDESTFDDTDEVTCDSTGSQTAEDNFTEKATREGTSEREITIQKVNHLSQQVIKNLELLKQEQARTNRPTVSVSQKRQMIVTLHEGLTLVNGLKARKAK